MRRPTRTRRLSIAAIVLLLLFLVVAGVGVRSFRVSDTFRASCHGKCCIIGLQWNVASFDLMFFSDKSTPSALNHTSFRTRVNRRLLRAAVAANRKFKAKKYVRPEFNDFELIVPLWPVLLLLLIAPMRWLFARRANARAFPVITDAKQP